MMVLDDVEMKASFLMNKWGDLFKKSVNENSDIKWFDSVLGFIQRNGGFDMDEKEQECYHNEEVMKKLKELLLHEIE